MAIGTEAANESAELAWTDWDRKERELTRRYDQMRERIESWDCPAPCVELKRFMLDQLKVSRQYSGAGDCPKPRNPREWFADQVSTTARSIAYHREHMVKSARRHAECIEWLDALQKSVPYANQPERG